MLAPLQHERVAIGQATITRESQLPTSLVKKKKMGQTHGCSSLGMCLHPKMVDSDRASENYKRGREGQKHRT